jgi:hypothetical protein
MEDFMEGIECPISTAEMNEAWHRFWNKNQLAINAHGSVYRTTIPRKEPCRGKFDIKNHASKRTMLPRI